MLVSDDVTQELNSLLSESVEQAVRRERSTFDACAQGRAGIVLVGIGGLGRRAIRALRAAGVEAGRAGRQRLARAGHDRRRSRGPLRARGGSALRRAGRVRRHDLGRGKPASLRPDSRAARVARRSGHQRVPAFAVEVPGELVAALLSGSSRTESSNSATRYGPASKCGLTRAPVVSISRRLGFVCSPISMAWRTRSSTRSTSRPICSGTGPPSASSTVALTTATRSAALLDRHGPAIDRIVALEPDPVNAADARAIRVHLASTERREDASAGRGSGSRPHLHRDDRHREFCPHVERRRGNDRDRPRAARRAAGARGAHLHQDGHRRRRA